MLSKVLSIILRASLAYFTELMGVSPNVLLLIDEVFVVKHQKARGEQLHSWQELYQNLLASMKV